MNKGGNTQIKHYSQKLNQIGHYCHLPPRQSI